MGNLRQKYTEDEWEELQKPKIQQPINNIDKQYQNLIKKILNEGVEKETRNGKTKSIFGYQIRHKMEEGFPLLTTKKLNFKNIWTELVWFLKGDTNIRYLLQNNNHIWDGDAYKNYLNKQNKSKNGGCDNCIDCYCGHTDVCDCTPMSKEEFINKIKTDDEFAEKWGDLGPIYGKQWREWSNYRRVDSVDEVWSDYRKQDPIDQIQNSIDLLKTDPDSRRNIVSAWNVGEMKDMVLPPCHNFFQFYTRELSLEERIKLNGFVNESDVLQQLPNNLEYIEKKLKENNVPTRAISLMWNQRSVDVGLGLGYNIASYAMLLIMIADKVGMIPDELIGNLGDTHIYLNHIEGLKEQLNRKGKKLPKIKIEGDIEEPLENLKVILEGYDPHPHIFLPLSN